MPSTDDPFHRDQPEDPPTLSANVTVPAALRAELEGVRQEHALAVAEAEHLRRQLVDRGEHIADLQRTLKALMPAPERPPQHRPPLTQSLTLASERWPRPVTDPAGDR